MMEKLHHYHGDMEQLLHIQARDYGPRELIEYIKHLLSFIIMNFPQQILIS